MPQKTSSIYFKSETPPVEFEEIANVPCLILLGEPGIGKSQAMTDAYGAMTTWQRNQDSHHAHSINLKEYNETDLTQELGEVLDDWASEQYYVETLKKNPDGASYDPITVVIEVKGCWNPQMAQAMETQLVEKYLKGQSNTSTYGLYLVGWFDCTSWHPSDHRRKQCQKLTLEKLQIQLERQASKLTNAGLQVTAFVLDAGLP